MIRVIFDTNAARDCVEGVLLDDLERFAENVSSEYDCKGFHLLISPTVILELLYHLIDKNDKDYSVSFKAIKIMMLVSEFQQTGDGPEIIKPMELLIANEVYHMHLESREVMYDQWMSVADQIAHGGIEDIPCLNSIDGGTLRDYIDEVEDGFAKQIRIVCATIERLATGSGRSFEQVLNSTKTENLLVTFFSRTTYNLLMNEGKLPDYHQFSPLFVPFSLSSAAHYFMFMRRIELGNKEIIRRYPAFLRLVKEVVRRIHQSNNEISDEKLKNYFWDISLMFHTNDHTINHEPFLFITSDKTMLKASDGFHDAKYVMSYKEYKGWMEGLS